MKTITITEKDGKTEVVFTDDRTVSSYEVSRPAENWLYTRAKRAITRLIISLTESFP